MVPLAKAALMVAMDTTSQSALMVEFANLSFMLIFDSVEKMFFSIFHMVTSIMINLLSVFCYLEFWSTLACSKWVETISM